MTYPVAQLLTSSSFHPVRSNLAENAINAALQDFTITTVDAARIHEFIAELPSCKNISTGRANKLTFTLISWRDPVRHLRHTGILLGLVLVLAQLPRLRLIVLVAILFLGIVAGSEETHAVWYGMLNTLGVFDLTKLTDAE